MHSSNDEERKDKGEKSKKHEKICEKKIIVENEKIKAILVEMSNEEKIIKLLQGIVKKYKEVRRRKWGKWVAE
ncbi:hypothetical protein HAX54_041193, partial [Datura stramonium]|nr:hypothetical protein [Datura stramonium]